MGRKIFKLLGKIFLRLDLGAVIGIFISLIVALFTGFNVSNGVIFTITLLINAVITVIVFQLIGCSFVWISNQFVYLNIKEVDDEPYNCNIEITNNYEQDLTDFRMELKRLSIIGYPTDCWIQNKSPFFSTGIRLNNGVIKHGDTATIRIAEIPTQTDEKYFMEFLIDEGWKSNYRYEDISNDPPERMSDLGILSGTIYEFIIVITGKVGKGYINPQVLRCRLLYLSVIYKEKEKEAPKINWLRLDKYSMKDEAKRNKSKFHFEQEIKSKKEDFWILLEKMKNGKMASIK